MRKIIIISVLIFISNIKISAQKIPNSFFSEKENFNIIRWLWNQKTIRLTNLYDKISGSTKVIGINYVSIKDIKKLNNHTDPIDNLKYDTTSSSYILVNNFNIFTDIVGYISELEDYYNNNEEVVFSAVMYVNLNISFNNSMKAIFNCISSSSWDINKVKIIQIEEYEAFFVLYEGETYVPNEPAYTTLIKFTDYFSETEFTEDYIYKAFRPSGSAMYNREK